MVKAVYAPFGIVVGMLGGAVVRAAITRGGARGFEKLTGVWPGG